MRKNDIIFHRNCQWGKRCWTGKSSPYIYSFQGNWVKCISIFNRSAIDTNLQYFNYLVILTLRIYIYAIQVLIFLYKKKILQCFIKFSKICQFRSTVNFMSRETIFHLKIQVQIGWPFFFQTQIKRFRVCGIKWYFSPGCIGICFISSGVLGKFKIEIDSFAIVNCNKLRNYKVGTYVLYLPTSYMRQN